MSEWERMLRAAREVDALYQAKDTERMGRPWSLTELLSQCAADWGELAEQIGKHQGFRPGAYDHRAAAHELGDPQWALMVIADRLEIDLSEALLGTMAELQARLGPPGS